MDFQIYLSRFVILDKCFITKKHILINLIKTTKQIKITFSVSQILRIRSLKDSLLKKFSNPSSDKAFVVFAGVVTDVIVATGGLF